MEGLEHIRTSFNRGRRTAGEDAPTTSNSPLYARFWKVEPECGLRRQGQHPQMVLAFLAFLSLSSL